IIGNPSLNHRYRKGFYSLFKTLQQNRLFSKGIFDIDTLPMRGKRKPNGHQEKRGKQQYQRSIHDRSDNYPDFNSEFGHLEGDTIVGIHHKSAVITL
ncbi:hypothetical protein Q3F84_15075, partial [Enterococcus faecium]|nr:hypothetical protein [Enterococcus faecium]MDQ8546817.1 hypothetical protein [Enterococcus faecium]